MRHYLGSIQGGDKEEKRRNRREIRGRKEEKEGAAEGGKGRGEIKLMLYYMTLTDHLILFTSYPPAH